MVLHYEIKYLFADILIYYLSQMYAYIDLLSNYLNYIFHLKHKFYQRYFASFKIQLNIIQHDLIPAMKFPLLYQFLNRCFIHVLINTILLSQTSQSLKMSLE